MLIQTNNEVIKNISNQKNFECVYSEKSNGTQIYLSDTEVNNVIKSLNSFIGKSMLKQAGITI